MRASALKNISKQLVICGRHRRFHTDGPKRLTTEVEDPYRRHLFDNNTNFNVYERNVINLSVGAPGPDLLQNCADMLSVATNHRLDEERKEGMHYLFQYGITSGLWECRDELSKFLSRRYGDKVDREKLILTCGATHGLQLILTNILAPNGVIFVEKFTYMIALDVFKHFPLLKVVTIPMKDDVVDLEAMDRIVSSERGKSYHLGDEKIFWGMFYTIPTYHNPTGRTLSEDSCKRLVEIARKNSIAVVCDDVYNLLNYTGGSPPHRLFYYDDTSDPDYQGGNVISNGSFSKILSPAIRLGWLECPPRVANIFRQSGILFSGGAVNHYISGVIASLLRLNIEDDYLDLLIKTYRERLAAVCDVLDKSLPKNCSYVRPGGGYFIWIHLPTDCDGKKFINWCQENYKVTAIPGHRFSNEPNNSHNYLRLSIAFHQTKELEKAADILCKALAHYFTQQK